MHARTKNRRPFGPGPEAETLQCLDCEDPIQWQDSQCTRTKRGEPGAQAETHAGPEAESIQCQDQKLILYNAEDPGPTEASHMGPTIETSVPTTKGIDIESRRYSARLRLRVQDRNDER